MKKVFILLLLTCYSFLLAGQSMDFIGENINITVRHDSVTVEAMYFFKTEDSEAVNTMLFYPIPQIDGNLRIGSVEVTNMNLGLNEDFEMNEDGLRFGLLVLPGKESRYRVTYRQKRSDDSFTYILTSTQAWNKPLKFSQFSLTMMGSWPKAKSFSYDPETSQNLGKSMYYEWNFRDFMPEKDFVIYFE